jgi:hypothetical protein
MKAKFVIAVLAAAIAAAACTTTQEVSQPSSTNAAPTALTGEEIKALVAGNTVEGLNTDGYYFKGYNAPDGKISASAEKGGKVYTSAGTWEIQGNTACAKWTNPDWKAVCATYAKNGDGYHIKTTSRSIPSIPSAKVVPGNPYNL